METKEFKEQAFKLLVQYAERNEKFLIEDARLWAYDNGLPKPEVDTVWGGVTRRAQRENIIERTTQFDKTQSNGAGSWHPVWRSKVKG